MSVYSNGFVVSIVVNGRVFEIAKDDTVAVPFGSEYSIRLRNKNNRRAVAKVFVDDQNVSQDGIVVNAYGFVDLERPTTTRTKFKFVSQESGEAAAAGKSDNEDRSNGVIRVEWRLERECRPLIRPMVPTNSPWRFAKGGPSGQSFGEFENKTCDVPRGLVGGCVRGGDELGFDSDETPRATFGAKGSPLQEGCTVEGGYSAQNFTEVHVDLEQGDPTVITLVLRGFHQETSRPLVKSKGLHCENCGALAKKPTAKFCYNCGNRLSV
jgi:hypothetical protein